MHCQRKLGWGSVNPEPRDDNHLQAVRSVIQPAVREGVDSRRLARVWRDGGFSLFFINKIEGEKDWQITLHSSTSAERSGVENL